MTTTPTDLTNTDTLPHVRWYHRVALGAIMLITITLHFARLDQEGFANLYYAATVKSMLLNWHNFFFASFDPGGFVTVDKPPLGFWAQAASAFIFGFNGVSLLLPQALAGVLSVALLYHLVARVFGASAGLIAALALAVTPISIAANRNNTIDSQLVFTLLLAAWAVSLAIEKGKLRWLLLCAILIGIGFNIKMLQAYMVLPAFWLTYLVAARTRWWKRVLHLALATLVLGVVSFAWVVVVDWTPTDERPYVGSSTNNTETELIVGHNGLTRLGQIAGWLGMRAPGAPRPQARPQYPPVGNQPGQPPRYPQPRIQPAQPPQPPADPLNDETGAPGILRLFNKQLAGQISWFLPLAIFGCIAAALATRLQYPFAREHQQLLLWSAWLAPQIVFFSFAGLFHRYYLEMMSPAIAALVGAGGGALWNVYRQHRWRGLALPLALCITAIIQIAILMYFPEWAKFLAPIVLGLSILLALALATMRLLDRAVGGLPSAVVLLGVLILLIAPTIWSITPVLGADAGLPFAGPELLARPSRPNTLPRNRLIDYLLANRHGAQFLVAMIDAKTAAPIILATAEPVMALGGFTGNDPILTMDELAQLVTDNTVRYFWLNGQPNQQAELTRWVAEHCAVIGNQVQPNAPDPRNPNAPRTSQESLYDCGRRR